MGDASGSAFLQERHDRLMEIRNRHYDELMAIPGVVNVAIGFKSTGDELTDEPSIVVLVERKKILLEIPPEELLPTELDGVRVDVQRYDEGQPEVLEPGDSVNGQRSGGNGTLGFFAKVKVTNEIVLVSNDHVLYDSGGQDGDEVGSPMHSSCCCCTCNVVGFLFKTNAGVDCAMAKIKPGTKIKTAIPGIGQVVGTADATMGMTVTKHGDTTDVTTGLVTLVTPGPPGVPVLTFRVQKNNGNDTFSKPGDSGSAVVDTATMKIVGLHQGGCNSPVPAGQTTPCVGPVPPFFSQAIGIGRVLTALNIEILLADPANESASGEAAMSASDPFDGLAEQLQRTPAGQEALEIFDRHWRECLDLVRHTRPVTVAWHRSQGPAWLAAFARNLRVDGYRLPDELNGVAKPDAIARVRAAFETHGSDGLRASLAEHGDVATDLLLRHDDVAELVGEWEERHSLEPGSVLGRRLHDQRLVRS